MSTFLNKLSSVVKGVICGFDRIAFKGSILPVMHDNGAASFLRGNGILNKDYKDWVCEKTAAVIESAKQLAQSAGGFGITSIPSSKLRKEDLARQRQKQLNIDTGLIGVWSAIESCRSFKAAYCAEKGFPQLRSYATKCKHLYFYFDHEQYGFMNIRLQTWFPYHIQFCFNGREWLKRDMIQEGIRFEAIDNKFIHIDDYSAAQRLLDSQLNTRWPAMLEEFLPIVFPAMRQILGEYLGYNWTMWQSEWATDYIFDNPSSINAFSDQLMRYAFMTGTSSRILHYLDRPITKAGKPYLSMKDEVCSRILDFADGLRVRHWVGGNSVKIYNQQNVLRVETTINEPGMFKVHRRAQGDSEDKPKRRMPLRKAVADIPLRAQVSQEVNDRFIKQVETFESDKKVCDLLLDICGGRRKSRKDVRGLDITGKDRMLLLAISDPAFAVSGITNTAVRKKLAAQDGFKNLTDKQLSAKVSRQLRLLRDHGIIRKLPGQKKYNLTDKGRQITTALPAMLNASIKELMEIAA